MRTLETERERYTDDGTPPLDWERYLEVAPSFSGLDAEAREGALAARELDGDTWSRAEGYWTLTLALDIQGARTDRVEAYGRACADHLQTARLAPRDENDGTSSEAAPVAAARLAASPVAALPEPSLPAAHAAHSALPTSPLPASVATPPVVVPTFLRASDAPRAPGPVAIAITPPRPAPALRPDATFDAIPTFRAGPLPFGQTPSQAYAARLATAPAVPTPAAANRADATVLGEAIGGAPALPFGAGGAGDPAPKLPELTLEQHATLSAELAAGGDARRRAAVLKYYGIESTAVLIAVGAHWQARLAAEPETTQRWKVLYAEQRARLQQESLRNR